jgi:t-SNARE complex subunit (syntaxin)
MEKSAREIKRGRLSGFPSCFIIIIIIIFFRLLSSIEVLQGVVLV